MMRAKDFMQTRVTRVSPDDPLVSVHRLFCDEEISGAPVVADTGEVLGVFRDGVAADPAEARSTDGGSFDRLTSCTVSDVMSPEVISVGPDSPLTEVVEKIMENRIHRVLVLDSSEHGGSLVGIISVFDLVQLLA
ncbi:MAG: CBS domain-containing protein [Deltaproteobacteria bacterium]|nr:CBS domain-containing protein [Deltaproteobacteria bacterium]